MDTFMSHHATAFFGYYFYSTEGIPPMLRHA